MEGEMDDKRVETLVFNDIAYSTREECIVVFL